MFRFGFSLAIVVRFCYCGSVGFLFDVWYDGGSGTVLELWLAALVACWPDGSWLFTNDGRCIVVGTVWVLCIDDLLPGVGCLAPANNGMWVVACFDPPVHGTGHLRMVQSRWCDRNVRWALTAWLHASRTSYAALDGNVPVSFIQKYLMKKLDLTDEAEVEIKCMGQPVLPTLQLYNLVDLWLQTASTSQRVAASAGSSAKEFSKQKWLRFRFIAVASPSDMGRMKGENDRNAVNGQQVLLAVRSHRLEKLITGEVTPLPPTVTLEDGSITTNEAYELFVAQNSALTSWILTMITPLILPHLVGVDTTTHVWHTITKFFTSKSTTTMINLHFRLKIIVTVN
ncbi:hypothetical protein F3Y22_tig00111621pilonHSYRG00328 [Hibiscus syriacus]|uniref:Uncharacterized protein n=1 Tax=Hibiscus syriacus TaxID=106335 RepID=A0A6A2YCU4_HIBSY|nr:hypothetical protein F3Y22_tig00111621pilonHSYRG00328 [Hibiscus syriacus]